MKELQPDDMDIDDWITLSKGPGPDREKRMKYLLEDGQPVAMTTIPSAEDQDLMGGTPLQIKAIALPYVFCEGILLGKKSPIGARVDVRKWTVYRSCESYARAIQEFNLRHSGKKSRPKTDDLPF